MESVLIAKAIEIEDAARTALATSPYRHIRDLRVQVTDQGIFLDGAVASYYHKQLAQELLRELALSVDLRVVNRIVVNGEYVSS